MKESLDLAHWTSVRDEPVPLPHGKPIPTSIRGFMWARELIHLNVVAFDLLERGVPGGVLEVGSYCGLSACALAQPGPLTCIDTFRDAWDPKDPHHDDRPEFDANMALMDLTPRVVQMDSKVALPMLQEEGVKFRFILIDGGHSYSNAFSDISKAIPLLSEGGAMAIDDKDCPGVREAAEDAGLHIQEAKGGKLLFGTPA